MIQIPDLVLTGWAGGRRPIPLHVWGPKGTRDMMDHIQQALAFDIHMRRDVDEKFPAHHPTAEQAGEVFSRIKPRRAVYRRCDGQRCEAPKSSFIRNTPAMSERALG